MSANNVLKLVKKSDIQKFDFSTWDLNNQNVDVSSIDSECNFDDVENYLYDVIKNDYVSSFKEEPEDKEPSWVDPPDDDYENNYENNSSPKFEILGSEPGWVNFEINQETIKILIDRLKRQAMNKINDVSTFVMNYDDYKYMGILLKKLMEVQSTLNQHPDYAFIVSLNW